ncbi:hypothetical protein HY639_04125 [Candidatus Woesearchaeota archaeon]|nr:hypothetical protein [Candidatus Woesearchaeota archaeon]
MFAFKGFKISKAEASIDIANTLHLLLTSTEVSPKTFLPIDDLPKVQLDFTCEDFSVDGQAKSYRNKIVFAPSTVTTTRLRLWSFDWNAPFYVTNMISITSPSVLYVFVALAQDPLYKYLEESIPKNITRILVPPGSLGTFKPTGHDQTRFIFANTPAETLSQAFANKKISGLRVEGKSDDATITFLTKNFAGSQEAFPATGNALLFGAIFSDSLETYKCNVNKATARLRNLAQIYMKKQNYLRSNVRDKPTCSYNADFGALMRGEVTGVQSLRKINQQLQQQSCPLIY